jgi:hypothetical protein
MAMSTPQERLNEVFEAFSAARQRLSADLSEATDPAQVLAILANVDSLEDSFLRTAIAALNASGAAVEKSLRDARAARAAVEAAYADAKDIAEKIRLVAKGAKAVADLVKKAQARPA